MSDFDLTEKERKLILSNSIERVINTSISLAMMVKDEDAYVNVDDWLTLKELVIKLWDRERNTIFKELREEADNAKKS